MCVCPFLLLPSSSIYKRRIQLAILIKCDLRNLILTSIPFHLANPVEDENCVQCKIAFVSDVYE